MLKNVLANFAAFRWTEHLAVAGIVLPLLGIALDAGFCVSGVQQPEIRVEVDLVNLFVSVSDRNGSTLQGLTKENFRVWEDDLQQEVSHFSTDNAPYTIGLVLDRSGSMADVINDVFQAAFHTFQASKPEPPGFEERFLALVQAYSVGYDRDFHVIPSLRTALGGQITLYGIPGSLVPIYGSNPVGIALFLRVRPFGSNH